jgi:hypothetical protein
MNNSYLLIMFVLSYYVMWPCVACYVIIHHVSLTSFGHIGKYVSHLQAGPAPYLHISIFFSLLGPAPSDLFSSLNPPVQPAARSTLAQLPRRSPLLPGHVRHRTVARRALAVCRPSSPLLHTSGRTQVRITLLYAVPPQRSPHCVVFLQNLRMFHIICDLIALSSYKIQEEYIY